MLSLSELEAGLQRCGHGCDTPFMMDGRKVPQTLPGLPYANDIVLMASLRKGLQQGQIYGSSLGEGSRSSAGGVVSAEIRRYGRNIAQIFADPIFAVTKLLAGVYQ